MKGANEHTVCSGGTPLNNSHERNTLAPAGEGRCICMDVNGNLYLTGLIESNVTMTPQSGYFNQSSLSGLSDAYILEYNPSHSLIWSTYYGGNYSGGANEQANTCTANGTKVFIAGFANSDCNSFPLSDSNPSSSLDYFQWLPPSPNFQLGFIAEFDYPITTSIKNNTASLSQFYCYPNPASDEMNFNFNVLQGSSVKIEIINVLGQTILTENYGKMNGETKKTVSVENFSQGIYLIKATINDDVFSSKFVKQ